MEMGLNLCKKLEAVVCIRVAEEDQLTPECLMQVVVAWGEIVHDPQLDVYSLLVIVQASDCCTTPEMISEC